MDLVFPDIRAFVDDVERRIVRPEPVEPELPIGYRLAFGLEVVHLTNIEFRILILLASRPYHPYSRKAIARAVTTERDPVAEIDVDPHVNSLRQQLHCFRDYVQSVPNIGYRFKA